MKFLGLLSGLLFCLPAIAQESLQDLAQIQFAAERFVVVKLSENKSQRIIATAGILDPRLRLAQCGTELESSFASDTNPLASRVSVGVRCATPKPWTLYIPVNVQRFAMAVSATRHLSRGQLITTDDVQLVEKEIGQLSNAYLSNLDQAIDYVSRHPLRAGDVLDSNDVQAAAVIKKGDRVTIMSRSAQVDIQMAGEALADGAKGDTIHVKNSSSRRTVTGRVIAAGVVQVGSLD